MNLTFRGFLKGYCRELAGTSTLNLKTLCRLAEKDAPRVAEPLLLYAFSEGKAGYLMRISEGSWMHSEYEKVGKLLENAEIPHESAAHEENWAKAMSDPEMPPRYRSVWNSYLAKKHAAQADRRIIGLMRKKTLAALREAGLTTYSLCKELGLNKGNVYAYLGKGDASKVSRSTARRIMEWALDQTTPSAPA